MRQRGCDLLPSRSETIRRAARTYEDCDDCLAAVEEDVRAGLGLDGVGGAAVSAPTPDRREIVIEDAEHGLPIGSYTVTYWRVRETNRGPTIVRQASCDRDVSARYVTSLRLRPMEVATARCDSQPGGAVVYGSARARRAWAVAEQAEARRACPNAMPGTAGNHRWTCAAEAGIYWRCEACGAVRP